MVRLRVAHVRCLAIGIATMRGIAMVQVSAEEAVARLSDLIAKAIKGEAVFIEQDEGNIVQLVPVAQNKQSRKPGTAKGLIRTAEDFDAPLEDFNEYRG